MQNTLTFPQPCSRLLPNYLTCSTTMQAIHRNFSHSRLTRLQSNAKETYHRNLSSAPLLRSFRLHSLKMGRPVKSCLSARVTTWTTSLAVQQLRDVPRCGRQLGLHPQNVCRRCVQHDVGAGAESYLLDVWVVWLAVACSNNRLFPPRRQPSLKETIIRGNDVTSCLLDTREV